MISIIEYLENKTDDELCNYYRELFYNEERTIPENAEIRQLVKDINKEIDEGEIATNGLSSTVYVATVGIEICRVMADRFYRDYISS